LLFQTYLYFVHIKTMKKSILLFTSIFFFLNCYSQDSIRQKSIEPIYLNAYYSSKVLKNKHFINISNDKELAILYDKVGCPMQNVRVNIKEYFPKNEAERLVLKFYRNNDGKIGKEYIENRMVVNLNNKNRSDFQISFNLRFSKIIEENSFFIGITIEGVGNNNSIMKIYSSKEERRVLYIRNNKIDYWVEESRIDYNKNTRYFFPSLQVVENCEKN